MAMPATHPPLVSAHIEGQARLRRLVERVIAAIWDGLPAHDRANVDQWLSTVVPVILQAQRASVSLTDAYIAQAMGRGPIGLNPADVIGAAVRNGVDPAEVYERPFVTLWGGLADGLDFPDASAKALARAQASGAVDVQLTMRDTAYAIDSADPNVYGYRRVADPSACNFCKEVDGAYVKGADGFVMALHNHCGCGLEVNKEPPDLARLLPDGTPADSRERERLGYPETPVVAIRDHGELGPVLVDSRQHFTGPNDF